MKKGELVEKYVREREAEFNQTDDWRVLHDFIKTVQEKFNVSIYAELPERKPIPGSLQASNRIYQKFWFEVWSNNSGSKGRKTFIKKLHTFSVAPKGYSS